MTSIVLAHPIGGGLPPPFTWERLFTEWAVEPIVLAMLLAAAMLYLLGVRRLRARGDAWSGTRTANWLLGLLILFVALCSAVDVYDIALFSMHSVQHLLLMIAAPVPLGFAAPVTLALRTLPRGLRGALLAVLHSRVARVLTHPVVAYAVFVVTPFALYYSPLFEATLRIQWVHDLSHLHLLVAGCLLYWTVIGVDPLPHRLPHMLRFAMILSLGPVHVVLGLPIMMSDTLLAGDFYLQLDRGWGPAPLADQHLGGALLWVFGDATVLLFLPGLLRQWRRAEAREARRIDRRLDQQHGESPTIRPWWLDDEPVPEATAAGEAPDTVRHASPDNPAVDGRTGSGERRP